MGCKAIDDAFGAARENVPKEADKEQALHGLKVELERNPSLPRYVSMMPGGHGR